MFTDVPVPKRLNFRPRNAKGYIVPFFAAWFKDGKPCGGAYPGAVADFRVVEPRHYQMCIRDRLCWLCGQKLGIHLAFVLGPMCTITRTTSEPPSHRDCAEYALQVCPFLTQPERGYNDRGKQAAGYVPPSGQMLRRNPGVGALWMTRSYQTFNAAQWANKNDTPLITVGDPDEVTWWCRGRPASRAEIEASIAGGLPELQAMADAEGNGAPEELMRFVKRAEQYLPA